MGVIKRGILGGFAGSVGNVVGSSWKGIAVMKAKPLSVANPRTAGQVAQRGAFGFLSDVSSKVLVPIIKPLWDRFAMKMSGYNAFIQANIANYNSAGVVNATQFVMSRGSLVGLDTVIFGTMDVAGHVALTWTDNSGIGNALATDELYLMLINTTTQEVEGFATGVTRADELVALDTTMDLAIGQGIYANLAFRRADGTNVSNSTAIGKLVTA
jgi:hypothetical protein